MILFVKPVLEGVQRWRHFHFRREQIPFLDHSVGEEVLSSPPPVGRHLFDKSRSISCLSDLPELRRIDSCQTLQDLK